MNGIVLGIIGGAGVGKDTAADYLVRSHGFVKIALADEMKRLSKRIFGFTDEQMWGPSEKRNAPDPRYSSLNVDAWNEATWNLALVAPEWCRWLFRRPAQAEAALFQWFYELRSDHGTPANAKGSASLSPRIVLQTLGTEFGRSVDKTVWVRLWLEQARKVLDDSHRYTPQAGLIQSDDSPNLLTPIVAGIVCSDVRFDNEVETVNAAGGRTLRLRRQSKVDPLTVGVANHPSEAEQRSIPDEKVTYVVQVEDGLTAFYKQLDALMERIRREQ